VIFLGYDFYGDESAMDYTPISSNEIRHVSIAGAVIDELYITNNIDYDMKEIPQEWDYDTVMHALFNNSLTAGNVNYTVKELTALRLKRREVGTYKWLTLAEFPISNIDDLSVTYIDRYAETGKDVEYMLVAVTSAVEGSYNSSAVSSFFDGIVVTEKDMTYRAFVYDYIPTERNQITSVVTTLKGRYPYVIKNADTNYTSGQIQGGFFPMIGCEITHDYFETAQHREELIDFLTNGKPKVLKFDDGRSYIINVVDNVSHTADIPMRYTSFNFVQTGDAENTTDLYNAGLIDVDL